MSDSRAAAAEDVIDKLAQKAKPEDMQKLDAQFASKLDELERSEKAPKKMIAQLRSLWPLLKRPDSEVPFSKKALVMAAVSYFVSPVDLLPDLLGGAGYLDDAMIVNLVHQRVADVIAAKK